MSFPSRGDGQGFVEQAISAEKWHVTMKPSKIRLRVLRSPENDLALPVVQALSLRVSPETGVA
ncbi:hypothetical protein [Novipirellula aureliae]|uniref:hypothetical protein n=1 Tax=Novipirellula aureliae TaxID=2527966 RepID=UPI0011B6ECC8|nr:hypothetical protein [Novipirellula aureliae]